MEGWVDGYFVPRNGTRLLTLETGIRISADGIIMVANSGHILPHLYIPLIHTTYTFSGSYNSKM